MAAEAAKSRNSYPPTPYSQLLSLSPMQNIETLRWVGGADGCLQMIDQTLLPVEFKEIECRDVESVWEAIKMLRVRGAPAIGIAARPTACASAFRPSPGKTKKLCSHACMRSAVTSPPADRRR